jgi:hypothetical protein
MQGSELSRRSKIFLKSSKNIPPQPQNIANVADRSDSISQSPLKQRSSMQIPTSQLLAETSEKRKKVRQGESQM